MDYKILAEKLVKKCINTGADAAEVYIESGRNLSIEVRNGQVETVTEAASHGAGFRVFVKGKMAFSHCNDFSDKAIVMIFQTRHWKMLFQRLLFLPEIPHRMKITCFLRIWK